MTHDAEKTYKCPVCCKEFTKPQTMKTHLRVHTGERPFRCSYCPKAFTTSGNLGDHLRVHSAARLFKCKICGAKFKRNATLKRHLHLHAKYKQNKECEESVDMVVSRNAREILRAEEVNEQIYFSRIDRTSEIIVSENGEAVQAEAHPLNNFLFEDLNYHETSTIELFFPPSSDRDDQHNFLQSPIEVKEEKLDDFHDATVLELSEELDLESGQLKVSFPGNFVSLGETVGEEEVITSFGVNIPKSKTLSNENACEDQENTVEEEEVITRCGVNIPKGKAFSADKTHENQENSDVVHSDLAKNYGAYVTKMLRLLQSKEKQVLLIKDLNHSLHEFLIENR